uniref:Uncharacterized protein n=1 Tax=Panagrellus redivivus TaxID=6233 RepID=A0A7E4VJP1_PANRE
MTVRIIYRSNAPSKNRSPPQSGVNGTGVPRSIRRRQHDRASHNAPNEWMDIRAIRIATFHSESSGDLPRCVTTDKAGECPATLAVIQTHLHEPKKTMPAFLFGRLDFFIFDEPSRQVP